MEEEVYNAKKFRDLPELVEGMDTDFCPKAIPWSFGVELYEAEGPEFDQGDEDRRFRNAAVYQH